MIQKKIIKLFFPTGKNEKSEVANFKSPRVPMCRRRTGKDRRWREERSRKRREERAQELRPLPRQPPPCIGEGLSGPLAGSPPSSLTGPTTHLYHSARLCTLPRWSDAQYAHKAHSRYTYESARASGAEPRGKQASERASEWRTDRTVEVGPRKINVQ